MRDRREKTWIRRIRRRRDKKAANELIHAYYTEIYCYVYRQVGERELSMDITQEIFSYLRERDRVLEELFRLKFYSGYTFAQIGLALELPESTVKTKYYAALKMIREKFSK